jgi:hypothetical protein
MCGFPINLEQYRVRVIASKSLTDAELKYNVEFQDLYEGGPTPFAAVMTRREMSLTVFIGYGRQGDTIMIDATDYATAMAELFRQWSPPEAHKEIES